MEGIKQELEDRTRGFESLNWGEATAFTWPLAIPYEKAL